MAASERTPPFAGWVYDRASRGWYDAREYSSYREAKTSSQNLGFRYSGEPYGWLSERQTRKQRKLAAGIIPTGEGMRIGPDTSVTEPADFGRWQIQYSGSLQSLTDRMYTLPDDTVCYFIARGKLLPQYETRNRLQTSNEPEWRSVTVSLYRGGLTPEQMEELVLSGVSDIFLNVDRFGVIWRAMETKS